MVLGAPLEQKSRFRVAQDPLELLFGVLWGVFGSLLRCLWHPLGSLGVALGSIVASLVTNFLFLVLFEENLCAFGVVLRCLGEPLGCSWDPSITTGSPLKTLLGNHMET